MRSGLLGGPHIARGTKALAAQLFAVLVLVVLPTAAPGASWSTASVLGPEGRSQSVLTSISCASAASCIAVGTADDGGEEFFPPANIGAFSEGWNGSSWSVIPTADAAGSGAELLSVSCVSPSFCVAVGATHSTGRQALGGEPYGEARALVETWNGSFWSVQDTPAGALPHSWLNGVTCFSVSSCVAVGAHSPTSLAFGDALVETWNGSKWKLRPTPLVSKRGSSLQGVSCWAPDACMAVGFYTLNIGPPYEERRALAERWNGHRWIVQRPPSGGLYGPKLKAVSCPERAQCLAVGAYLNGSGTVAPSPLVERWQRGRWRRVKSGLPRYSSLEDVSCVAVNRCLAVGQFDPAVQPSPDATAPLIMSWSGGRWSREPAPDAPAPATQYNKWDQLNPALFGISCPAEGGCTAVGAQAAGSASAPLAQTTSDAIAAPATPNPAKPKAGGAPKPLIVPTTAHRAAFRATCPLAERCRERVVIKAGGKVLARGRYSVPAHSSKQVFIALTGAGEQALAHRNQIAATLTIVNVRTHKSAELPVVLTRR